MGELLSSAKNTLQKKGAANGKKDENVWDVFTIEFKYTAEKGDKPTKKAENV